MLDVIRKFWGQRCSRYRNFQIVFTLLTLNFAIPTLSYVLAPEVAVDQFREINRLLGGASYEFPEEGSRLWRYLGSANVATLALMCFLLQVDLRRYRPVLVPLTFMKFLAATLWLGGYLATPEHPVFLAAAVLDYVTSGAFVFFAVRAHRQIADVSDEELIPPPLRGAR